MTDTTEKNNDGHTKTKEVIYAKKLYICAEKIAKQKQKFITLKRQKRINDKQHDDILQETLNILFDVGDLSMGVFNQYDDLREKYTKENPRQIDVALKLFEKEYSERHKPYNILKNRCFRLIEELDSFYIEINGKNPNNLR